MSSENLVIACIAIIIICWGILMLPYTIDAYIIMSLNDIRSFCGF